MDAPQPWTEECPSTAASSLKRPVKSTWPSRYPQCCVERTPSRWQLRTCPITHARYVTLLFALLNGTHGSRRMMGIRVSPAAPSWTRLSRAAISGAVTIEKSFRGKVPKTHVRITEAGRGAIDRHWTRLQTLRQAADEWGAALVAGAFDKP